MDKNTILQEVATLSAQGAITPAELEAAYRSGRGETAKPARAPLSIANLMYYLGGAIVIIGIVVLINENWSHLNAFTKVLVTLGSSIAAFVVATLFDRQHQLEGVANAFFFISAATMPVGVYQLFQAFGLDIHGTVLQIIISGIVFVIWLAALGIFKRQVFALFTIIFGTWFYYAVVFQLLKGLAYDDVSTLVSYATLAAGVAYGCLAMWVSRTSARGLTGFLYFFGSFGLLGAAFSLGGSWSSYHTGDTLADRAWELVFPAIDLGVLFASVSLRTRALLVTGSLFMLAYIFKLTSKYFAGSLGWPFALIVAGLAFIGVGYLAFYLNKKYLKTT